MLIDRFEAKIRFDESINSHDDWIYIIGNYGIGKSYFIKHITKEHSVVYCEPNHYYEYWKELLNNISIHREDILKELVKDNTIKLPKGNKLSNISIDNQNQLLEEAISQEIQMNKIHISRFLGEYLSGKYNYIVLDNMYKCDTSSYNWMISLLDVFCKKSGKLIIVICDSNKKWSSQELKEDLLARISRIKIERYDNSNAYAELINTTIHFDNDEILNSISKDLYKDFSGQAESILNLLSILKRDYTTIKNKSDSEKALLIKKKAAHLSQKSIECLNYLSNEILAVLAIAPSSLSVKALAYIIDEQESNIHNELNKCLQNELVERLFNKSNNTTVYKLSDLFTKDSFINNFKKQHIDYFYEKIYRAYYQNLINIDKYKLLDLAIKCDAHNAEEIANSCFNKKSVNNQKKQEYATNLNEFLTNTKNIPSNISSMFNVNVLYDFGYYQSAYKIICNIDENNYRYFMRKGDIEHLLLHQNTSVTFEKASKVKNISISQKLSAINREIMALTQENKTELEYARALYKKTILRYQNIECNGLIELYRNSNNIFDYSEAIEYTIKGYNLAIKLNNNIEKIKSLHNLCMLKVLNGCYYDNLNREDLDIEPDFKMICKEFENQEEFLHELAYPLLDLGTLQMFEFVKNINENTDNLYSAKKYYSRAQLYARSFYAKNIATMGLLVVNSYLYCKDSEYVVSSRNRIFQKYLKEKDQIKDFRIHRKILFSLATSAVITGHIEEGKSYLLMSKPHVFENETLRYNNLCEDLGISNEKIAFTPKDPSVIREYHQNSKFVPWLISFGH